MLLVVCLLFGLVVSFSFVFGFCLICVWFAVVGYFGVSCVLCWIWVFGVLLLLHGAAGCLAGDFVWLDFTYFGLDIRFEFGVLHVCLF